MSEIPFTQYILPHGRRTSVSIDRPDEISSLAERFIESGGRYEAEVLTTGHVSLTACLDDDDIGIEVVNNGPGVAEAVDRLVHKSVAALSDRAPDARERE
jgi:hypothetical protein